MLLQIVKIIGFSFLGLIVFTIITGMVASTPSKPGSLEDYLDNSVNKRGFPIGEIQEANTLIQKMLKMDKSAVKTYIDSTDLNLTEASYALYFWAMRHIQEGEKEQGLALLEIAATDYLNPLALTKLARFHYHNAQYEKRGSSQTKNGLDPALEQSYYQLILAFEICNRIHKNSGDTKILNHVTNEGLALLDTFTSMGIRNQFNTEQITKNFRAKWEMDLNRFELLYY